jgi:hypothetical protein
MRWMFKKVNTREDIVGFYSTGPKVRIYMLCYCLLQ